MATTLLKPLHSDTELLPSAEPVKESKRTFWLWALLFGFVALVYLGTTGALPLVGRDEPRYVQIGREMLESGDWVTPRLGGFTWFEKPILLYWMVAASFGVFGVNEWAARLGPALCGLGTVASVWWMVRRGDEKWARWSALSLATSGALLAFAHGATFDIPLTVCVSLSLAGFFLYETETKNPQRFLAVFWIGMGLAFMAKGLVAFILTLGTVGLYSLLRRRRINLKSWWGLPLCLLVSALWYGPVIWANGEKFVYEFFVQHHFERYLSDKYKHHQPPYFYLEILPLFALPWTPFLVSALWKLKLASLREDTFEAKLKALALAWMIVPVAFFSISGSKLPGYILPAIPGAFLLIGFAIKNWTATRSKERFSIGLAVVTLLGVALLTTTRSGIALADKASSRKLFLVANQRGYRSLPVVQFGTMERTAQFYAASTLMYDKSGEPLRLESAVQVATLAKNQPLLVIINTGDIQTLRKLPILTIETLASSGKVSLLMVRTQL